ncbi:hypothetical protein KIN20_004246 [Parelaphostrongylus tenuis]|uniref:Uncharacterized protein n=1 Tax=Parelaphostrongylus tenuis TaxID=148309 RepID=A0AAD5QEB2_PARTN|nr:hypothetical protein KIN20_004246 [Parelaphostrongylus tenuis]
MAPSPMWSTSKRSIYQNCRSYRKFDIVDEDEITWRQNDRHAKSLAECYLALKHERQDILEGKKARFTAKTFSRGEEGKEIVISKLDSAKSLTIRASSSTLWSTRICLSVFILLLDFSIGSEDNTQQRYRTTFRNKPL